MIRFKLTKTFRHHGLTFDAGATGKAAPNVVGSLVAAGFAEEIESDLSTELERKPDNRTKRKTSKRGRSKGKPLSPTK